MTRHTTTQKRLVRAFRRLIRRTLDDLERSVPGDSSSPEVSSSIAAVLSDVVGNRRGLPGVSATDLRSIDFFFTAARSYAWGLMEAKARRLKVEGHPGQYYTPLVVARRLVELVQREIQGVRTVFDPACGAGSLLLAWLERHPTCRVIGWDRDPDAVALARSILDAYAYQQGITLKVTLRVTDLFAEVGLDPAVEEATAVVLVNPPYGTELDAEAVVFASSSTWSGREPDLFALALEKIARFSSVAAIGAIIPDVVRMQPEYLSLRRALNDRWRLRQLEQLPFGSFPEATVQPDLVVITPDGDAHDEVRLKGADSTWLVTSHTDLRADDQLRWSVADPRLSRLWEQCATTGLTLGQIATCHEGIHTGNIRSKLFTDNPKAPNARPMLKGADVFAFGYRFARRFVRYDSTLIRRDQGEYASLRDPEIFFGPKLFSRQTSNRLVVCLDSSDLAADNTLHSIKLTKEAPISLFWLAILLNSALATVLYRVLSGEGRRPLPQIKITLLNRLPLALPSVDEACVQRLFERAKNEATSGRLAENTFAETNGMVFDSFGVGEGDRTWILQATGVLGHN